MITKLLNRFVGAKYVGVARAWVPNLVSWGAVGGLALVHFTDWKVILKHVPYIRGKFAEDE